MNNSQKTIVTDEDQLLHWKEQHILNSSFDDGLELEEIVERLCVRMGLPDLIIKNPCYSDSKGIKKEICDLILLFKEYIVVFQVKHRALNSSADSSVSARRAEKTIHKLTHQFSTFLELYHADSLPELETVRGFKLQIKKAEYPNLIFVGIVAFPGQEYFDESAQLEIINGFRIFKLQPMHLFHLDCFNKMSLELDTPKDLIEYLEIRKTFFSETNIGVTSELDLLAFYKMNPKQIKEASSKGVKMILDGEMWKHYVNENGELIIDRNKKNSLSYIYDLVLNSVHQSVDFALNLPANLQPASLEPGSIEAYFKFVNELSDYGRVSRRSIGEAIKVCLTRAETNHQEKGAPFAYRLLIPDATEHRGIIFLAVVNTEMSREKRINFLHNLCITAEYKFKLKSVIGIATESFTCTQRSFDFASMGGHTFASDDKDIIRASEDIWKAPQSKLTVYEYKS